MIDRDQLMRLAIESARTGIGDGQSPFGCAIAACDEVVAIAHNRVLAGTDITAHAEINAIREACRRTGRIHLDGFAVASTCEPCAMCLGALHWARVGVVYFGASIEDAAAAGFNELKIPARSLLRLGESPIELVPGVLEEACRGLFAEWAATGRARRY
jgi:tRNA(Arg) A34 adenosine deaminase TadA